MPLSSCFLHTSGKTLNPRVWRDHSDSWAQLMAFAGEGWNRWDASHSITIQAPPLLYMCVWTFWSCSHRSWRRNLISICTMLKNIFWDGWGAWNLLNTFYKSFVSCKNSESFTNTNMSSKYKSENLSISSNHPYVLYISFLLICIIYWEYWIWLCVHYLQQLFYLVRDGGFRIHLA